MFLSLSKCLSEISNKIEVEMPKGKILYLDFCPMANNNKGGFWLNIEKEIKNPYFGSSILKCVSVKKNSIRKLK